jgi:hypothetical protein
LNEGHDGKYGHINIVYVRTAGLSVGSFCIDRTRAVMPLERSMLAS